MKDKNNLKIVGIVASAIGACITLYGVLKFNDAQSMLKTLGSGDSLFGTNSSSSIEIWTGHSNDYKLMLIIGVIILIIGIVLLISGILAESNKGMTKETEQNSDNVTKNIDISEKLKEIEKLKLEGVISIEEYEKMRDKIISNF